MIKHESKGNRDSIRRRDQAIRLCKNDLDRLKAIASSIRDLARKTFDDVLEIGKNLAECRAILKARRAWSTGSKQSLIGPAERLNALFAFMRHTVPAG
jgi:hypothetical protein